MHINEALCVVDRITALFRRIIENSDRRSALCPQGPTARIAERDGESFVALDQRIFVEQQLYRPVGFAGSESQGAGRVFEISFLDGTAIGSCVIDCGG